IQRKQILHTNHQKSKNNNQVGGQKFHLQHFLFLKKTSFKIMSPEIINRKIPLKKNKRENEKHEKIMLLYYMVFVSPPQLG
ncbi:hypothetical protein, partial [uncultured Methanobrevibacter sp.]